MSNIIGSVSLSSNTNGVYLGEVTVTNLPSGGGTLPSGTLSYIAYKYGQNTLQMGLHTLFGVPSITISNLTIGKQILFQFGLTFWLETISGSQAVTATLLVDGVAQTPTAETTLENPTYQHSYRGFQFFFTPTSNSHTFALQLSSQSFIAVDPTDYYTMLIFQIN